MVDLRYSIRMLRKNPMLTVTAALTLALGIGANAAIFTMLYGLVLRSLPPPNASQLVKVGIASTARPAEDDGSWMTYQMLNSFGSEQFSFRDLSGWVQGFAVLRDKQGSAQRYTVAMVGGNAFNLLGLQPYKGRFILPSDDVSEKAYLTVSSARAGMLSYLTYTYKKPLYLMQGLVGIVSLLCCVNIAGLMMSRVAARQQEFAVRTAVGAPSRRLVLQCLTERFVIAALGSKSQLDLWQ